MRSLRSTPDFVGAKRWLAWRGKRKRITVWQAEFVAVEDYLTQHFRRA